MSLTYYSSYFFYICLSFFTYGHNSIANDEVPFFRGNAAARYFIDDNTYIKK